MQSHRCLQAKFGGFGTDGIMVKQEHKKNPNLLLSLSNTCTSVGVSPCLRFNSALCCSVAVLLLCCCWLGEVNTFLKEVQGKVRVEL